VAKHNALARSGICCGSVRTRPPKPAAELADRLADARDARRLAEGDEGALRELYGRYGGIVHGLCLRQLGDRGLAEECTQDVFATLWRRAGDYDARRGRLSTWLFAIARNRIIDAARRRALRPAGSSAEGVEEIASTEPGPELALERLEAAERTARAMAELPEAQLEVIQMAYFQGLSQSEIAERTGMPLGTVKGRLRLAMNRMRELLVPDESQP
jgi:RNA polymerase sigma-70 factor (ECF subfamily)